MAIAVMVVAEEAAAAAATTAFLFALLLFKFLKNSYEIRMCWTVFRKRLFSNCLLSRERKNKTTWKKWISFILHTRTNYTHTHSTYAHNHDRCENTCERLNACTQTHTHMHMMEGPRRWPFVRVSTQLWKSSKIVARKWKFRRHDSKWKLDCVQRGNKGKHGIHFCVPHLVWRLTSCLLLAHAKLCSFPITSDFTSVCVCMCVHLWLLALNIIFIFYKNN